MTDLQTEFDVLAVPVARGPQTMNVIGLDLGTFCGWAMSKGGVITHGTKDFSPKRSDGPGQRWLKFRAHLANLYNAAGEVHVIYYEDVKRHVGTQAAHAYGAFESHLQVFCDVQRIRLEGVGVGQIKKNWTGDGRCEKGVMVAEARRRGFKVEDDNAADALAILDLGIKRETK